MDSIFINASIEKVYIFLIKSMTDVNSFKKWCKEYVNLKWMKGETVKKGSILHIEEYLGDKLTFKIVKNVPNKYIKYRILYPLALFAPGNEFIIESKDENSCQFTARGKINIS